MIDREKVIVVTGLPRSGTSMCMKMLEAGGCPVLTDGERVADEDNPNGYYEYEPVKSTRQSADWLSLAQGKAVKMVYRLLYDLPPTGRYDVLFMRRDMNEVLASQQVMLTRRGVIHDEDDQQDFNTLYRRELRECLAWLKSRGNFRVLQVDYNSMMRDSAAGVVDINAFLGGKLRIEDMRQVIDPSLYRNRSDAQLPA